MRDSDVRQSLHAHLREHFAYDPSTMLADELGILQGQVRVDVAAVNGSLYGFEIKAAADTLDRLPSQVDAYGRVLDFAVLVAAERHVEAAERVLPPWWGIYVAASSESGIALSCVRGRCPNPQVHARSVAELLWHSETLVLLEQRDAARGLRRRPRADAWERLCEVYTLDEIRNEARKALKGRAAQRAVQLRP